jgi:hypothetical protein
MLLLCTAIVPNCPVPGSWFLWDCNLTNDTYCCMCWNVTSRSHENMLLSTSMDNAFINCKG